MKIFDIFFILSYNNCKICTKCTKGEDEMIRELTKIIKTVYENTGIDVLLYAKNGTFIASATEKRDFKPITSFENIYVDTENHSTHFKIFYRTDSIFCQIEGDDATARNYAYMLSGIIESLAGKEVNLSKDEFAKRIILGDCGGSDVHKFKTKFSIPELPFYVLAVKCSQKVNEVLNISSQYVTNGVDFAVKINEKECVLIKFVEDDGEYQSSADFAFFLANSIIEELGLKVEIGVGGTFKRFEEACISYQQAATALRMSGVFKSKGSVHTYREYILIKMLEDIPESKLADYLSVLLDGEAKELLKDEEMVNTAEEFLENSLNVSETSRNLYMHRNTLMYRLDKIERIMGLNLRKFSDAVTFRIITILNKLLK